VLAQHGDQAQATRRLEDWTRLLRWLLWRHLEAAKPAEEEAAA
jgi:hypothetical protein